MNHFWIVKFPTLLIDLVMALLNWPTSLYWKDNSQDVWRPWSDNTLSRQLQSKNVQVSSGRWKVSHCHVAIVVVDRRGWQNKFVPSLYAEEYLKSYVSSRRKAPWYPTFAIAHSATTDGTMRVWEVCHFIIIYRDRNEKVLINLIMTRWWIY